MSNTFAEQARTALENLDTTLKSYAAARPQYKFVGQFLDEEGWTSDQHGVYGMGAWIALAEDSEAIRHLPAVRKITDACKIELKRLVNEAQGSTADAKAVGLRIVIPKICYAYIGLVSEYPTEANELSSWIAASQRPDGSWGYLTSSKTGCPEITSLVVRTFGNHPSLKEKIKTALEFLRGKYSGIDNLFLRLFTLNSLIIHDDPLRLSDYRKTTKKVIRTLLNQAFFNPTRFPNPINLDFNDGKQTRYIRLSTDVIFLDSLQLISPPTTLTP